MEAIPGTQALATNIQGIVVQTSNLLPKMLGEDLGDRKVERFNLTTSI